MNIGMLWFDNDPKVNLDSKIERAALYYRDKYGSRPTLCFVHPSMLNGKSGAVAAPPTNEKHNEKRFTAGGIEVRSNQSVLPNHLWIGVNGGA
ncbi:MAG: hypothetical protein B6D39_03830 [Anaerolineae bacterium UTCFX2]|jgi:hypothetical protein|nr:hypothetical protein [Anaerolineae bacterium]MCZ7552151.1 hypothetical protein [Anaerolineales bacterium]OQY93024.1 MAG: hypothetical protein B6D39_03830 [Anaerolineae bacterium UTCFX2]